MLLIILEAVARAADEPAAGFTLREIWEASGFIARSVIVVLSIMALASVYVAVERLIAFNRARNQSMQLAAEIIAPLQQGDVSAALTLTGDDKFKASYLAALLRAVFSAGIRIEISSAMMPMTTSNSTSVNAFRG